MSQKKIIIMLTICLVICFSFVLLNNDNRINISNNDIIAIQQAKAATVFSNIEVTARKDTSATIQWNTDIPSTEQIEYGLTTNYGNLTNEKGLSYWQPIEITDLTEGTTYHYRIRAKDIDDNETISNDYTFTTRTQSELDALVRAARTNNDLPKIYYVKTNGDDTKDGLTIENAWQSPTTAAQRAEAGDVIYLMDGTWIEYVDFSTNSGTSEAPIVMKAYNGTPTIEGSVNIRADYITFDGLIVHGSSSHTIDVRGVKGIKILNCEAYNSGVDVIYFNNVWDSLIENCTVHDSGWNGIGIKPSSSSPWSGGNILIKDTVVYDCPYHNGFDIQGTHLTFINCSSNNSQLAPFRIHADYITLENCTANNGNNGINAQRLNNALIHNCSVYGPIWVGDFMPASNVTIANNNIDLTGWGPNAMVTFPNSDNEILIENNEVYNAAPYPYYIIWQKRAIIRNENILAYRIELQEGGSATVEYTDGRTFSVDGNGEHTSYTVTSLGTYTIEVEEPSDLTPPHTTSHTPSKNSTSISKQTNISLHIQDNDSGVNQSSIQMTVEGIIVSPIITGTTSDYTLTYNPPADFDYNQVVNVTIGASDLASTPNAMDTETYSFTIQSSPDEDPPTGSILINSGDSQTNSQTANLTISATDESGLSEMKISETNNFSSATAETYSTIKSFILSIGDGIKTIYIWFKDTIGNWNTEPYSDSIELDSTGPTILNIQSNETTNSSTITFQTNELSTSYIEYGLTTNYGMSTSPNLNPLLTFAVQLSDLSSDTTYHYRIISEDSLTNSSNSTDQTFKTQQSVIPDSIPPQAINDLSSSNITQTSADLSWTSPGDDGNTGTASEYDIRYSRQNLSDLGGQTAWWSQATEISGEPIPQSSGTEQSIYIAVGLSPSTTYYFAIKTSDEVPNTSDISNILSFTTQSSSGGGGGGGGGTISDTTPPSKPSNFIATGADKQITLRWNNPTDSDFVRVKLLRKENSYPLSHNDSSAETIYEGTNQEYTDIELNNNTTYYYSIFAYDKKPNYSEVLSIYSKPIEGKTSISNGNGKQTYPEGTLIKIPESFKIYVIINQKKKWIPTPEVFETLGYQWTNITEINKTELNNIENYEDNLIRAIQDYKVYLIVNGIKRHIPNPEIFLNYGFEWDDVKDVNQETINQYSQNLLIKESKQQKVYYLCPERKIRRWLRSPEIFNSYNNKWEDIQVISKYEMEHYMESNLIKLIGDNKVYLIENNTKRWIKSSEEFNRLGLDWEMVMEVNSIEGSI